MQMTMMIKMRIDVCDLIIYHDIFIICMPIMFDTTTDERYKQLQCVQPMLVDLFFNETWYTRQMRAKKVTINFLLLLGHETLPIKNRISVMLMTISFIKMLYDGKKNQGTKSIYRNKVFFLFNQNMQNHDLHILLESYKKEKSVIWIRFCIIDLCIVYLILWRNILCSCNREDTKKKLFVMIRSATGARIQKILRF